jgi:hypothetical protein
MMAAVIARPRDDTAFAFHDAAFRSAGPTLRIMADVGRNVSQKPGFSDSTWRLNDEAAIFK